MCRAGRYTLNVMSENYNDGAVSENRLIKSFTKTFRHIQLSTQSQRRALSVWISLLSASYHYSFTERPPYFGLRGSDHSVNNNFNRNDRLFDSAKVDVTYTLQLFTLLVIYLAQTLFVSTTTTTTILRLLLLLLQ